MRAAFSLLLLLAVLFPPAPTRADEAAESRRLLVEAVRLAKQAETASSLAREIEMLAEAVGRLDTIILRYPSTEVALDIITGNRIGAFDPAGLRRSLTEARLRDPSSHPARLLATVKAVLENMLLAGRDAPKLKLAAPLTVIEQGETLQVRFQDARLAFDDAEELVVGDVTLNVVPISSDRYRFSADLPLRLAVRELPDGPEMPIATLAASRLEGVWSASLQVPTHLRLTLDGLRLLEPYIEAEPSPLSIGRVALDFAFADWTRRVWYGPFDLRLTDFRLLPEPGLRLEIADLHLAGQSDGIAQSTWLRALDVLGISLTRGEFDESTRALGTFVRMFGGLRWGRFDHLLKIRGLRLLEDEQPLIDVATANAQLVLDASGDAVSLGLAGEVKGIRLDEEIAPAAAAPTDLVFEATFEDLPIRSSTMTMLSTVFRLPPVTGLGNIVLDDVDLLDMVLGPVPRLRLGRLEGRTSALTFGLTGDVGLDIGARTVATGVAAGWIQGLEEGQARNEDVGVAELFADLIELGRAEEDRHLFDIRLDRSGVLSVNGREIDRWEP